MSGLELIDGAVRLNHGLPRPVPEAGEARVRVTLAGVCATDLALARGYMDFRGVPGHEFVGVALDGPLAGQRVVGEINVGCGSCWRCAAGDPRHCTERSVLGILGRGGAFAEELCLPHENLLAVPDAVPDEAAVFAEPLAAALAVVEDAAPAHGEPALVIGDGRLGLLCAAALREAGAAVSLLGRHPERVEAIGGGMRHLERPLDERPPLAQFPLVVEASGRTTSLPLALDWLEPRGRLVLKTTPESPVELDATRLVVDELRLIGSRCGRFAPALEALASGRIDPRPLITGRYPLSQGEEALGSAFRPGALKVLLDITSA
ncbi:MAG: alcohol dehydrogenase catalytic domain-containing protein [Planctomycetota bacterium]